MNLKRTAWLCYAGVFIVGAIDLSKDAAYVGGVYLDSAFAESGERINVFLQALLLGFVLAGAAQLVTKAPNVRRSVLFVVLGLTAVVIYGICSGLLQGNVANYTFGEPAYMAVYPGMFALLASPSDKDLTRLKNLVFVVGGITFLKYAVIAGLTLSAGGNINWRYFVKFSFIFLPMGTIAISYFIFATEKSSRFQYFLLSYAALVGLVLTSVRGFFIGYGVGVLFIILCAGTRVARWRVLAGLSIAILLAGAVGTAQRGELSTAFGYWWGTELFEAGLKYRADQFQSLMGMFAKNPVFGVGFGAVIPNYVGLELGLARPYFVELEYVNLLAKLGVAGFIGFVAVFSGLFYSCFRAARRAQTNGHKALATGTGAGLVALTVASFSNSYYSSIYFHLYVIMTLTVISHISYLEAKTRQRGFTSRDGTSGVPVALSQLKHSPR